MKISKNRGLRPLVLLAVLCGLVTGCRPPETAPQSLSEVLLAATAEETLAPNPTPSEVTGVLPFLKVSERQKLEFLNLAGSIVSNADTLPTDPVQLAQVAGIVLVADRLTTHFINQQMRETASSEDRMKLEPLLALIDGPETDLERLIAQTGHDFHLTDGSGAVLLGLDAQTVQVTYDSSTGTTELIMPIFINPMEPTGDVRLTPDADLNTYVHIQARALHPSTLKEEVTTPSVLEIAVEPSASFFGVQQQLRILLVGSFLGWSEIMIEPGLIVDDGNFPLFVRYFHFDGLNGADAAMALRPFGVSNPDFFPARMYGGQEARHLPIISEAKISHVMQAEVEQTLALHVIAGNLTRDEADSIIQDTRLQNMHPVYRAAIQMGSIFSFAGGAYLMDAVLGENHSQSAVRLLFESDTEELNALFAENPPSLENPGLLWQLPDEQAPKGYLNVYIMSDRFKNGEEPIQIAAAEMIHEMLVHDRYDRDQWNSMNEEIFGNLIETLIWARMIQADPDLRYKGTPLTKFLNLRLMVLLNSQSPQGSNRFALGLLSTHAPPDYEAIPGHQALDVPPMRGFVDFIRFIYEGRGVTPVHTSFGSENTRLILLAFFAQDDPEIQQEIQDLDLDGDGYPDFSENLIHFLDQNLHTFFTN